MRSVSIVLHCFSKVCITVKWCNFPYCFNCSHTCFYPLNHYIHITHDFLWKVSFCFIFVKVPIDSPSIPSHQYCGYIKVFGQYLICFDLLHLWSAFEQISNHLYIHILYISCIPIRGRLVWLFHGQYQYRLLANKETGKLRLSYSTETCDQSDIDVRGTLWEEDPAS